MRSAIRNSSFDRAARTYGLVGTDFFSDLGATLVAQTPVPASARVLDIGAGTGAVTLPAARRAGSHGVVVAIDTSQPMLLRLAARRHTADAAPILPVVMDCLQLGLPDESQDVVVSGLVLSSLANPGAAINQASRVLRPGGSLGLSIAPGWWWQEDPGWQWHDDLVRGLGLSFSSVPSMGRSLVERLLIDAPLGAVHLTEESRALRWDNWEEFWRWGWSHGWRTVLEGMTESQLGAYEAESRMRLDRSPSIEGRIIATLATATRL